MSEDEKKNRSKRKSGALDKFGPGGELSAIEDRPSSKGWEVFPSFQRRIAFAPCKTSIAN
jgi:hypothetical protein